MRQSIINGVLEKPLPKHQTSTVKIFNLPEQNKWYTFLDAKNVRLYYARVSVLNADETLEVKATIDGNEYTTTINAVNGTGYNICMVAASGGSIVDNSSDSTLFMNTAPLDARHIKLEVRKTTANGTGAIRGAVTYALW